MKPSLPDTESQALLQEIRQLIAESRAKLAVTVNAALTTLYWHIGQRIQSEILKGQRAEYGQQVLSALSQKLTLEYGRGWSERNLAYMVRFADVFPDINILHTLCAKLSWSHFRQLITIEDSLKRDFYTQMCVTVGWSTRLMQERIDSMLYERTALSKKPEQTIAAELELLAQSGTLVPSMLFKDPYVLDFLQLNDRYLEKDLEDAILRELENFLLELGAGFTFVARQKRLQIDNDDFYIDLLFYNRRLKRLVAIDLKLGDFKAADKGQMELYLRWLAKHEQEPGEASPLGIILCSGKKQEQIELLELDQTGIHVAEYLTELPPKAVLQQKLHEAIANSRQRLDNLGGSEA